MTAKRIRHLPVLDKGKLVGLMSIGDLVKQISQDQKYETFSSAACLSSLKTSRMSDQ